MSTREVDARPIEPSVSVSPVMAFIDFAVTG